MFMYGDPLWIKNDDKNTSLNTDVSNTNDMEMRVDSKLNFGFSLSLVSPTSWIYKGLYFKRRVSILSMSFAGFECVSSYR